MKKGNFIRDAFSENGEPSSKRIVGCIGILCVCFVFVWLALKEGGTETVKGICETLTIACVSLIGVSSVTSIWKKDNDKKEEE